MKTMSKDAARAFLVELGEMDREMRRLFGELAVKAEAKKPAEVIFPNDPKGNGPGSPAIRFFYLLFDDGQVLIALNAVVGALSDGTLQVGANSDNSGNRLKLTALV